MYPEAKSVGSWLRNGWHVTLAYVVGFAVMLAILGWHPDTDHRAAPAAAPRPAAVLQVPAQAIPGTEGAVDPAHPEAPRPMAQAVRP